MTRWKQSIRRWLEAERSNENGVAEAALIEVFRLLEDPVVPAGFARAVMRRIGAGAAPVALPVAARWAIAAVMIAAAFSLAYLPLVLKFLSAIFQIAALVELTGTLLVGASSALASWLELWQSLAEVNRILFNIISRPNLAVPLLAILGVSVVAFRLFSRLMTSNRSTGYA